MAVPIEVLQSRTFRPRTLRMVEAPSFSALPHAIMRDTSLSRDARLLYAILQGYWWQGGECYASHATLAAEMGCTPRYLRVYLNELIAAELVFERLSGSRRSKVYTPIPIGAELPIETPSNRSKTSQCPPSNAKFSTVQSEVLDTSNRSKTSHSKKKTPEKKTQEEKHDLKLPESLPLGESAAGAAAEVAACSDQAKLLRGLTEEARTILDFHRQEHGRRRPAKLTPASVTVLEEAVADLGVDRLREAVTYLAGKMPPVPELSKAINAARTKRQKDTAPRSSPRSPNGAPSRIPTDSSKYLEGRHGPVPRR